MNRIDAFSKCLSVLAIAVGMFVITGRFHVADNPFLAFAFAGLFLLHVWARPCWGEVMLTVFCGLVFAAGYLSSAWRFGEFFGAAAIAAGAFLGQGSIIVLLTRALWCDDPQPRRSILDTLLPGAALAVFVMVAALCLMLTDLFHRKTYDLLLYAFDDSLGFQSSFLLGRLFRAYKPLENLGLIVYEGLPLAVAFLYAVRRNHPGGNGVNVLNLFVAVGIAGFVLYQVYPAAGPLYVFGNAFPDRPPAVSQLSIQPSLLAPAPRNAMPSLHAAWALLIWWNSRRSAWWVRGVAAFVLLVTLMVTLGSGEHYFIDLIVAVPFSLAMQAACSSAVSLHAAERSYPLMAGGAMTAAWLALLRFGIPYFQRVPMLSWALVLSTLAASAVLRRRLDQCASYETPASHWQTGVARPLAPAGTE